MGKLLATYTFKGYTAHIYEENWKELPEYPGVWISDMGRYKKATAEHDQYEKILSPKLSKGKWVVTSFIYNGKTIYKPISRLVAMAFVPIPEKYKGIPVEKLKVRNIDGNHLNNRAENLEWYSHEEMYTDEVKEKMSESLTKIPVSQFDREGNWIANYKSASEAAKKLNCDRGNIWACAAHRQKVVSAQGYYWEKTKPEYGTGYQLDISNKKSIVNRAEEWEYLTPDDIEEIKKYGEEWRDIPEYSGIYQASNYGRIRSRYRDGWRIMKLHKLEGDSYYRTCLKNNMKTKTYLVHRLIAITFIPIPQELADQGCTYSDLEVNHKDENIHNNKVSNLEWCTRLYNINYGTCQQRKAIATSIPHSLFDYKGNFIRRYNSAKELGEYLGVWPTRVSEAAKAHTIPLGKGPIIRKWEPKHELEGFNILKEEHIQ